MTQILVADDNRTTTQTLCTLIGRWGHSALPAFDGAEALALLESQPVDVLVTDLRMPHMDGMQLLRKVNERWPDLVVLVVTAFGSIETAVEAMKLGAFDFLTKPYDNKELRVKIERAAAQREMVLKLERMNAHIASFEEQLTTGHIIGSSPPMQRVLEDVAKVAPTDSTVLILGESGTGKELVAREIHAQSARSAHTFVAAHCAAYAQGVLESELFGHEKGSFTGASARKLGRLELADKGTLFLDKIGEISPEVQIKLLRVLQEREYERVGGTQTLKLDGRVVAATNKDLTQAIASGHFREDLFYRLNVFTIYLPPLRARREDIPDLVEAFCHQQGQRLGRPIEGFSQRALAAMQDYAWPGNVRELQNVVERAAILAVDRRIDLDDLAIRQSPSTTAQITLPEEDVDFDEEMENFERRLILHAYEKSAKVKARTAKMLGIDRNRLRYKLKKYGIDD
jgi:two-component system, NtrC family, response regulator HydG